MNGNKWYKGPRAGEGLAYRKISVDGGQGAVWCKMNLRRWEGSFEETWKCHLKMPNKQWIHWVRDLKGVSCSLPCCSAMCNSLRPHGLHHTRLPCPSPSPRAYLNAHPLSLWNHPTISSSVTPYSPALNLPSTRVFSSELALHIRWPKYWSFSFSIYPCNEYSGLI